MKLSIITINYNEAAGLKKTLDSVAAQTGLQFGDLEHIIVDGASTDGSVDVIRQYEQQNIHYKICNLQWLSEPDSGIYNAMNKGIRMATGDYIEILNAGDILATPDVTLRMLEKLAICNKQSAIPIGILYGNMIKCYPDGREIKDYCFRGQEITLLGMYSGTLNHDPAYIRRDLFDKYGYYDESLRICSDWEWYLDVIIKHNVQPIYVDIDVTRFDMTGISENGGKQKNLIQEERRHILEQEIPARILNDYDLYSNDIYAMRRLRRYSWAYKMVWFLERVLFKFEKYRNHYKKIQIWG